MATQATTEWIDAALLELQDAGLTRRLSSYSEVGRQGAVGGRSCLNLSSNDYLGLARHPQVIAAAQAALRRYGCGATASRLVSGTLDLHTELEHALAAHKGAEGALVFGSGFLTNIGVIPTLVGRGDRVFADRLVHASLIDGIKLSGARLLRFRHNDAAHLEQVLAAAPRSRTKRLIVTESVFSMDGDLAPLSAIANLAHQYDAMLMVDEAHATGVFGPAGAGRVAELGLCGSVTVVMGTLSKALGSYGGYVACGADLRKLLINRSRSFIYSTGLPPAAVGAALGALQVLRDEPDMGKRLLERARHFRVALASHGLDTAQSISQIVPVMVGNNHRALAMAERLRSTGVMAVAIRPPTVPPGTARLRLSLSLTHTAEEMATAADRIAAAARGEGVR